MKVAYKHLINFIPSEPSIEDISDKLFQLGHEHEIHNQVFDMELTPNRGDCLSINGLLRDLGVFYDISLSNEIYLDEIRSLKINFNNKVPKICPNISFLKIDIENNIKPYKGVLHDYFNDLDINKNNFFTDISNYISYEMGQPTHCYDATKIKDTFSLEIIKGKREFQTLMDNKIELNGENLVFLQHNANVMNLAGIMGDMDTACNSNTRSVIIECAYFKPEVIIGKSIKYNINSDAAHKFERGVDPLCHEKVLRRFIKIVEDHAEIKNIELFKKNYLEFNPNKIPFDEKRLNKILGISLNKISYENYLLKLNFVIKDNMIYSPSYRADISTENDIAEEIARVIGYNNIKAQSFKLAEQKKPIETSQLERNIKNLLIDKGFFEVVNNPFVNLKKDHSIKVDNPLDLNRKYLRTNMKKSLIENLLYNERRQHDSVKLFECSDIYFSDNGIIKNKKILGIICSGRVGKNYVEFSKNFDKNYLINIFDNLDKKIDINPVFLSRELLNTKLKSPIIYAEIELNNIEGQKFEQRFSTSKKLSYDNFVKYQPISRYPASSRDISFSIKNVDRYYDLQEYVLNYKNDLIKEIYVFDFFINKKNNEIKLGFRFIFQSKTSTIKEKEVNDLMSVIIDSCLSIDSVSIPGLN